MRTAEEVATHVGLLLDFMRRAREAVGWTCALLDVGGSLAVPTQVPLSARARRMAWTFGVPPDAPWPTPSAPASTARPCAVRWPSFAAATPWPAQRW